MTFDKQSHADAADLAVDHPIVQRAMSEFAANMGFQLDGLPAYGLHKVAAYAAQVARAQALELDPETLRLTAGEANSLMLRRAAEATLAGIPTYLVDPEDQP